MPVNQFFHDKFNSSFFKLTEEVQARLAEDAKLKRDGTAHWTPLERAALQMTLTITLLMMMDAGADKKIASMKQ